LLRNGLVVLVSAAAVREWAGRLQSALAAVEAMPAVRGDADLAYAKTLNVGGCRELAALLEASAECVEALRMADERYHDVLRWLGPCEHDVGHCVCVEVRTAEVVAAALAKLDVVKR